MNRKSIVPRAVSIVAGLAAAASLPAQTITDGNSTFTMPPANTTGAAVRTGTTGGTASTMDPGGSAVDQLFQQWWWYRVNGVNAREFALSGRTANVASGNTLTLDYTEPEGFTARLVYVLTDGPDTPSACNVSAALTITNNNAANLSIAVFNYLDYDLAATLADTATLVEPGRIRIDDTTGVFGQLLGINSDAYQVQAFVTLRNGLTDADVDNLNNTGLPFASADFTGAHQWNLTIGSGQSATIRTAFSFNVAADAGGDVCVGDTDGDGDRDLADLARLLANFGVAAGAGPEDGDTDGDGDVDLTDLATLLTVFGSNC